MYNPKWPSFRTVSLITARTECATGVGNTNLVDASAAEAAIACKLTGGLSDRCFAEFARDEFGFP